MLIAEGHDRHLDLPLLALAREEAKESVLQHAEGKVGAVDDKIRPLLDGGQQLLFPLDRLLDGDAAARQRVGTARLLIPAHKRAHIGVHIQNAHDAVHGLQIVERAEQLAEAVALAHVGHEGDALIAAVRVHAQLRKARQQRHGHIVHAVVFEVLQDVGRPALPGAGQTGDDQKFHAQLSFFSCMPGRSTSFPSRQSLTCTLCRGTFGPWSSSL